MGRKKNTPDGDKLFSRKLASLRRDKGVKMDELARQVAVSKSCISLLESGERQPSREIVLKLAEAFFPDGNDLARDELLISAGFTPLNLNNLDQRKDLIALYEEALAENNYQFKTYTGLVIALIKAGRFEHAQEKIQQGFRIYAESLQLQCLLANLELARGNYQAAIVTQQAAIEQYALKPEQERRHVPLADLILNLGIIHFLKGYQHLSRQIEADAAGQEERAALEKQAALEDFRQARLKVSQALELEPSDIYALDEYARINFNLAYLSQPEEAKIYWQGTIDGFKSVLYSREKERLGHEALLEASAFLAHAYSHSGRWEEAEFTLQLLTACCSGEWLVHYIAACFYSLRYGHQPRQKWLECALQSLQKAVGTARSQQYVREEALKDPDLKALRTLKPMKFNEIVQKESKDGK